MNQNEAAKSMICAALDVLKYQTTTKDAWTFSHMIFGYIEMARRLGVISREETETLHGLRDEYRETVLKNARAVRAAGY